MNAVHVGKASFMSRRPCRSSAKTIQAIEIEALSEMAMRRLRKGVKEGVEEGDVGTSLSFLLGRR